MYSRVVKTGVPKTYAHAKRGNAWLIGAPFLLIVLGTIGLGGIKANRSVPRELSLRPFDETHNYHWHLTFAGHILSKNRHSHLTILSFLDSESINITLCIIEHMHVTFFYWYKCYYFQHSFSLFREN